MMWMQSKNLLLVMLLSFAVTACGGGGAAGSSGPNDSGNVTPPTTSNPDTGGSNPDTGGSNPDAGGSNPDTGGSNPDNGGTYPDAGGNGNSGSGGEEVTPPETLPPMTGNTFIAYAPYWATIGDNQVLVDLGASKITHDFGGSVPFFNPEIGRSDIITINVWNPQTQSAQNVMGHSLTNEGVKDRVFKDGDFTAIGVVAGDGIVEEKLRTQVNAFRISTRKHYEWQMKFRLGGRRLGQPWHMAPAGESPGTIWQLKTIGFGPALGMVVDTDPNNPNRIQLHFDARIDPSQGGKRLTQIGNLDPNAEQDVRIETYLDERTVAQGGRGFLKITVNGLVLFDQQMPTVQAGATSPYNWSMGMYLYTNTRPLSYDRFIYFRTARLVDLS
ncbi:hypothetical protein [Crenobacter intestini]|uniref:Polysaccharide lyase family 7 protein n=1 Tax=Crenobacter intestini TaxID=2563443 RepID=A0A4V4N8Q7_9NEIS|nr:hypothetical protein [Crenobacter intestini]TIC85333.1 hypothetical protein E5K04_04960 [Crenobacter intestini]